MRKIKFLTKRIQQGSDKLLCNTLTMSVHSAWHYRSRTEDRRCLSYEPAVGNWLLTEQTILSRFVITFAKFPSSLLLILDHIMATKSSLSGRDCWWKTPREWPISWDVMPNWNGNDKLSRGKKRKKNWRSGILLQWKSTAVSASHLFPHYSNNLHRDRRSRDGAGNGELRMWHC